jgi:hypothetical protein
VSSSRNIFTVRIRGIYSTALAKIFLDEGFVFGDLSIKLMNRLGIGREDLAPYSDLTIKNDDEYKDVIVFMGFPEAVDRATEIFRKYFTSSIIEEPKPLYAVYKGVVEKKISQDECLVSTPLKTPGVLRDMICSPGQELILTITGYRNDLETPILRRGISVVGKYMILDDTGRVQFSEHIRDSDVIEELRGFTEIITRERFGVKWRSSAKNATTINILEEYTSLKELYRKVLDQVANADNNRFLYVGEKIGFMQLSTKDLIKLDEIRSYVYPTAPLHHMMKTYTNLRNIVDLLDLLSEKLSREDFLRNYYRYIIEKIEDNINVFMIHRKLFYGETITIGPAKVLHVDTDLLDKDMSLRFVLYRYVRSEGLYDGLNVPKKPGDIILTFLETNRRYIIHAYFGQDHDLKGVYINVNTEVYPLYDIDPRSGKEALYFVYNDLCIDGVIGDNFRKIIDEEEFNRHCEKKRIREEICEKIRDELNNMMLDGEKIFGLFKDLLKDRSLENLNKDLVKNIFYELYKYVKR